MTYADFIARKESATVGMGFEPIITSPHAFPFQADLIAFALRNGRAAIFADCGLGKTLIELVWAANVAQQTAGRVIILAPLAVSLQHIQEAEKFGLEAVLSRDGTVHSQVTVTNYERLHLFDPADFSGAVCDESSILKNFNGARRREITQFMRHVPYRLLCTATAAPNDYVELGTSSEALGILGHMDMLDRFFKKEDKQTLRRFRGSDRFDAGWRFKGHAEVPFWRWVSSWARCMRKPSDLGFEDDGFVLPELRECRHEVTPETPRPGMLLNIAAQGLAEQRIERRHTLKDRCDRAAEIASACDSGVLWCQMNAESARLKQLLGDDCVEVSGPDSIDIKEERLLAFANGEVRFLVTKPRIAGFGLNLQRHANVITFPSHSYEQHYQSVRRCWRFGQKRPVTVNIVHTPGELKILSNLARKSIRAERMFDSLLHEMNAALKIKPRRANGAQPEVPSWIR